METKGRAIAILAALAAIRAVVFAGKRKEYCYLPTGSDSANAKRDGAATIKIRTLAVIAALVAIGAAGFVYFGVYNVAATRQHSAPLYYLLHYAMRRSVIAHAGDLTAPPDLGSPGRLRQGFSLYREHCLQCHGAPGIAPDLVGFGTRPEPVYLPEAIREWKPAEVYWVVKHGIKMTGMPAWEYHLSDQELWDLTAFVKQLPAISPKEYQERDRAEPQSKPAPPMASANAVGLGDPEAGKHAIQQYLCITCHSIPGETGANKNVGPPLDGIANRKYIGGVLPNTPENMIRWLRNPQQVDPLSGMPNLRIREQDLRDIVAYLYTLDKAQ